MYYNQRHKLKVEYSGYEELSDALRSRIATLMHSYISTTSYLGVGQEGLWVSSKALSHELFQYLKEKDILAVMWWDNYGDVFTAIEIFLSIAKQTANLKYSRFILPDVQRAFILSGSVYKVNDNGTIELKIEKELAKNIEDLKPILTPFQESYALIFNAIGGLVNNKITPEKAINDIWIAFENYLKEKTDGKDFSDCMKKLNNKELNKFQTAIVEKLHGFRSDSFSVAHAGNSDVPDTLDALWFIESVVTYIKLIDKRSI